MDKASIQSRSIKNQGIMSVNNMKTRTTLLSEKGNMQTRGIKTARAVALIAFSLVHLFVQTAAASVEHQAGIFHPGRPVNPVPVPASERDLQTVTAQHWVQVSDQDIVLEGAIMDAAGNLLFCNVTQGQVIRITPDKQLSVLVTLKDLVPTGLAFDKDGRLFIAAINIGDNRGGILSVGSDGSDLRTVISPDSGYLPNDLVFDRHGGFYFTDFQGSSTRPEGGVYYVPPNRASVQSVISHLALANGIALSPDGKTLWTTEFGNNRLHRVELDSPGIPAPLGSLVAYHFIGPAPDSMRADAAGNIYVAIYGQGKVIAFNKAGIPVGQLLIPGRDEGHNLLSTSLALNPGAGEIYAVTSDGEKGNGASVFRAKINEGKRY